MPELCDTGQLAKLPAFSPGNQGERSFELEWQTEHDVRAAGLNLACGLFSRITFVVLCSPQT